MVCVSYNKEETGRNRSVKAKVWEVREVYVTFREELAQIVDKFIIKDYPLDVVRSGKTKLFTRVQLSLED